MWKPLGLLIGLAIFGVFVVACGDDATPVPVATPTAAPTATPIDLGAVTSALEKSIQESIEAAGTGLSAADVQKIVAETAGKALSAADVQKIVATAAAEAAGEALSAADVQRIVAEAAGEALSAADVQKIVAETAGEALSAADVEKIVAETAGKALSAADVRNIVTDAIRAIPTVTPVPTATAQPTATPPPTAMPGRRGGHPTASTNAEIFHWGIHECGAFDNTCLAHPAPNYNGLITYNAETDDTTDIICDLCKDWDLADDGVTYTFRLHENARWNNGKSVTAADVVFSLDRMVDPDKIHLKTRAIGPFYKESRVIDEHTVEVETNFQTPSFFPFLASAYMAILSKEHVQSVPDEDMKAFEHIMGSGPFKVVSAESGVKIEYERNEVYFKQGRPYFDGITLFVINDVSRLFAAFKTQQVLFTIHPNSGIPTKDGVRMARDLADKIRFVIVGPTGTQGFEFQTETPPWDNAKARHALYLAVHRRDFTNIISDGADLLGGPFQPNAWYGIPDEELVKIPGFRETADGKKHPDDIAEAKRLFAELDMGEGFKQDVLVPLFAGHPDAAAIFQSQMKEFLGWEVNLKGVEIQTFLKDWFGRNFSLSRFGYGVQAHDPHDFFTGMYTAGASSLHSDWSHPRIEEIAKLQARELDRAKRKALVDEATRIFMTEDVPILLIRHTTRAHYSALQIQNHHPAGTFSDNLKAEHYWCEPGC